MEYIVLVVSFSIMIVVSLLSIVFRMVVPANIIAVFYHTGGKLPWLYNLLIVIAFGLMVVGYMDSSYMPYSWVFLFSGSGLRTVHYAGICDLWIKKRSAVD